MTKKTRKLTAEEKATFRAIQDIQNIWKPYNHRTLPDDHIFWEDVDPESKKYYPAEGQTTIAKAILSGKYKLVVVEFGRQAGKSSLLNAIPWYMAMKKRGAIMAYYGPLRKQVERDMWKPRRAQTLNAFTSVDENGESNSFEKMKLFEQTCAKMIEGKPRNDTMTINWVTGAQLTMDGADDPDTLRGSTADLIILDECRDMKPGVYDILSPTVDIKRGTIVAISSTAFAEGEFTMLSKIAKDPKNKSAIYFKAPSWISPYHSIESLEEKRMQYISRGELDVWKREYCAEFTLGGSRSIFPMVTGKEIRPHQTVLSEAEKLTGSLDYFCVCDPGSADRGSAFAVIFAAYHAPTRQLFLLDEIYATAEGCKSVGKIEPQIAEKIQELAPHLDRNFWTFIYDEAATWFRNEMQDKGYGFAPTCKRQVGKDQGISTIKDIFLDRNVTVSAQCKNLMWELTNYIKDDNGRIPKKNDHLIDALRYLLAACHYHIDQTSYGKITRPEDQSRAKWVTVEDDLNAWGSTIFDDDCSFIDY